MKLQLLFQKVYFKSNEWKELNSFLLGLSPNISIFLLSKNIFFTPLKQVKESFLGECVVLEIMFSDGDIFNLLFDLISKIQNKYPSKFFLIGFLWQFNEKVYFLTMEQMKNYFSFYKFKQGNLKKNVDGIHSFFLYDFLKFIKLNEVFCSIRLSFFKNQSLVSNRHFSYYY